jgi:hypothetical protein
MNKRTESTHRASKKSQHRSRQRRDITTAAKKSAGNSTLTTRHRARKESYGHRRELMVVKRAVDMEGSSWQRIEPLASLTKHMANRDLSESLKVKEKTTSMLCHVTRLARDNAGVGLASVGTTSMAGNGRAKNRSRTARGPPSRTRSRRAGSLRLTLPHPTPNGAFFSGLSHDGATRSLLLLILTFHRLSASLKDTLAVLVQLGIRSLALSDELVYASQARASVLKTYAKLAIGRRGHAMQVRGLAHSVGKTL